MTGITRDQRDARVTNFVFLTCAASYVSNHGVGVLYVCTGCPYLIMALVYCTCVQVVSACYGPLWLVFYLFSSCSTPMYRCQRNAET